MDTDVLIIGGGLAGLSCAKMLENCGVAYLLLEASEAIGGRIRTDHIDGFSMGLSGIAFVTRRRRSRQVRDRRP
jgi:protoporphyrinogen oxidase